MKRVAVAAVLALTVVLFQFAALACDKPCGDNCPFKSGKAKITYLENADGSFFVTIDITGTPEEIKAAQDKIAGMIDSCSKGTCGCDDTQKAGCPWSVPGLKFDVKKVDKGLTVDVTGGCPGKRGMFKARLESKITGKPVEAPAGGCGGCPGKVEGEGKHEGCGHNK